jgi:hypothetical protein
MEKYVCFCTDGELIPGYRTPVVLRVEMNKDGYKILELLFGVSNPMRPLQTKVGTSHWIYPYTRVFDTKEEAFAWVQIFYLGVLNIHNLTRTKIEQMLNTFKS